MLGRPSGLDLAGLPSTGVRLTQMWSVGGWVAEPGVNDWADVQWGPISAGMGWGWAGGRVDATWLKRRRLVADVGQACVGGRVD